MHGGHGAGIYTGFGFKKAAEVSRRKIKRGKPSGGSNRGDHCERSMVAVNVVKGRGERLAGDEGFISSARACRVGTDLRASSHKHIKPL